MKKDKIRLLVIFIGIIIVIYPVVANILASYTQTNVISNYNEMINNLEENQIEQEIKKAREYNQRLNVDSEIKVHTKGEEKEEKTSYLNVLNIGEIMGYIEIPKINIYLPIYHGTNDNVLQSGVGHVENSSFPIGEKNTHTVLAGHSGLARTKIFDDIDDLEEGDIFFLYILGEKLAYEVDQVKVVLPDNTKDIEIENDKEYVTLLTCTPFAINSHRLLVRGERIENYIDTNESESKKDSNVVALEKDEINQEKAPNKNSIIIILLLLITIVLGIFLFMKNKKKITKRKPRISRIKK